MDQDTGLAWRLVRYDIAVFCSDDAMEEDLPWPTAWAILNGLNKKPLVEGYTASAEGLREAA
jgi:hypothetical protein